MNANHGNSTKSVQRPMSAQTRFSASFHQSLLSLVKQNNEFRKIHGVQSLHSVTGKTTRPQTANHFRNSQFKTLDQKSFNRSQSFSTLNFSGKKKKKVKKCKDLEFTLEVSDKGNAIINDIPKAVYDVEIVENAFFQRATREANLFKEASVDNTCTIYVPLDRQITSCTSLYFLKTHENAKDYDAENEVDNYFSDLEVRALLLIKAEEKADDESEDEDYEETEYEEEFYYDQKDK